MLVDREPLARRGEDRAVLLGDAAHPLMPYMAQGATETDWVYGYSAWTALLAGARSRAM